MYLPFFGRQIGGLSLGFWGVFGSDATAVYDAHRLLVIMAIEIFIFRIIIILIVFKSEVCCFRINHLIRNLIFNF